MNYQSMWRAKIAATERVSGDRRQQNRGESLPNGGERERAAMARWRDATMVWRRERCDGKAVEKREGCDKVHSYLCFEVICFRFIISLNPSSSLYKNYDNQFPNSEFSLSCTLRKI